MEEDYNNRHNKIKFFVSITLVAIMVLLLWGVFSFISNKIDSELEQVKTQAQNNQQRSSNVLGIETSQNALNGQLIVNVPAAFNESVVVNNKDLDVGDGRVTGSNLVYSLIAGSGVIVTGDPQNPTVSASDGGSAQNIFKNITFGNQTISATSNNDNLQFVAGSNVNLSLNNRQLVISAVDQSLALQAFGQIKVGATTLSAANASDLIEFVGNGSTSLSTSGGQIIISTPEVFETVRIGGNTITPVLTGNELEFVGANGLGVAFDGTNRVVLTAPGGLTAFDTVTDGVNTYNATTGTSLQFISGANATAAVNPTNGNITISSPDDLRNVKIGPTTVNATTLANTLEFVGANGLTVSFDGLNRVVLTSPAGVSAISSINSQTGPAITFGTGTSGTDFGLAVGTNTLTFNLPDASATARGVVSTGTQTFAGAKTFNGATTVISTLGVNGLASLNAGTTISGGALNFTGSASDALSLNPYGASTGNTSEQRFLELTGNGSEYVGFKAPDSILASQIYTLPDAAPTITGQVLSSTTAGILSWSSPVTGVTTIGTINSQTKSADGAVISGSSLVMQTADGTNPGLVSTGVQTFAGNKTFAGGATISSGQNLTLTGNANSLLYTNGSGVVTGLAQSDGILRSTSGVLAWDTSTYLTAEIDGVIGNEVTNATNSTLTRSGAGTGVSPYTLALNLSNANNWSALQTFGAGATISSGQTLTLSGINDSIIYTNGSGAVAGFGISGDGVLRNTGGTLSWDNSTYITSAITSINSQTGPSITLNTGTSGTDFGINSSANTITLNLPDASATARGLVTTGTQTLAGAKTFSSAPTFSTITSGSILFAGTGGLVSQNNSSFYWDNVNTRLAIGNNSPNTTLDLSGAITTRGVTSPGVSAAGQGIMYFDSGTNKFKCSENGAAYVDCISAGDGSGATSVGTIDSQTKSANGGVISGVTLYFQTADGTNPGLVSTGNQVFEGIKTFNDAPVLASITQGSVIFAGTGGAVTQDNTNFFWDDTNNRLGLGANNPSTILDVNGAVTQRGIAAPSLSNAGEGVMYFDSTDNKFKCSENGGGFVDCISAGDGVGVTTIGAIDSQTKSANGAVISGSNIYLQTADATSVGLVSIGAQTFAGTKTFANGLTVSTGQNLTLTGVNDSLVYTNGSGVAVGFSLGANGVLRNTGGTLSWDNTTYLTSEVDGVIGNEFTNVTDATLTRSGSGTGVSPYTVALNLSNANTWSGLQTFGAGATVSSGQSLTLGGTNNSVLYTNGSGVVNGIAQADGVLRSTGGVLSWDNASYLTTEVDGVIGNEVTNATNGTLTRSGSGTGGSPYTLGLNLGNANTWTATQTFNAGATIGNAQNLTLTGINDSLIYTDASGIATGFAITGSGVLRNTAGTLSWDNTTYLTAEVDGIIGNEVTNATNGTLTRSGSGTGGSPYTLGLNLSNANTWSGLQTFGAGATISTSQALTLSGVNTSVLYTDGSGVVNGIAQVDGVLRSTGGVLSWDNAAYLTTEVDGVIGNEFTNVTNATLTRSGSGTGGSPYTVALNLSNANTWAALQTFGSGATISAAQNLTLTGNNNSVLYTDGSGVVTGLAQSNGVLRSTGGVLAWDTSTYLTAEVDGVIGNEVTNATDSTLTRSGSGTGGSPYTLALNLANANTWSATQSFSNATAVSLGAFGGSNTAGSLRFASAGTSGSNSFYTTFTAGTQSANITYTLPAASADGVLRNTAGTLTWDTSTYLTAEVDGVIGNEVTNVTDSTLTRSGSGTGGSPYTLGLNLGNANTWTATQTFSNATAASFGAFSGTNTPGSIRFASAGTSGSNSFYTTFTAGTQAGNITYTLPTSSSNGVLRNTGGALSWDTNSYLTSAITSINSETGPAITFATGTSGTDFALAVTSNTLTFNLPDASASNRGVVTTGTQTLAGAKTFSSVLAATAGATITGGAVNFTGSAANAFNLNPYGVSTGNTSEQRFLELAAGGTEYVGFKAPDAITTSQIYTLPSASADGILRNTAGTLSWDTASYLTAEVDGVIGNEVTNATDSTLTRSGSGTGGSPYTLGINLGNANTWTASQTLTNATAATFGAFSGTNTPGSVRFASAGTSGSNSFYTTFTAGTQTANVTYTLPTAAPVSNGQVLSSTTAGVLSWASASGVTGSGTATRLAFWDTSSSLSSSANLYWNNTNSRLGINDTTPATALEVKGEVTIQESTSTNSGSIQLESFGIDDGYLRFNAGGTNGRIATFHDGFNYIFSVGDSANASIFHDDLETDGALAANAGFYIIETGASPTFYTGFLGGNQTADINYTLPTAAPSANNQVLVSSTAGVWRWSTGMTVDTSGNLSVQLTSSTNNFALCHETNGAGAAQQIKDCAGAPGADYMEMYSVTSDSQKGDIVYATNSYITTKDGERLSILDKATSASASKIIGIVSDKEKAGDFNSIGYNINDSDNPQPIALKGRLHVNMDQTSENISVGDLVTVSAIPGKGKKLTESGYVVGKALESWNPGQPSVMIFVQDYYYNANTASVASTFSAENLKNITSETISTNSLTVSGTTKTAKLQIGDSNGTELLSVVGNQSNSQVVSFVNTNTADLAANGVLKLATGTAETGIATNFIQFYAGSTNTTDGTQVGQIRLNNGGVAFETSGADFAEYFAKDTSTSLSNGDIVVVNSDGYVGKSNKKYDSSTLGVITDSAAFVGNVKGERNGSNVLVGLVGQIKTNVSNINGDIKAGDRVAVSEISGFAMKAIGSGMTLGIALEDFNATKSSIQCGSSRCGTIKVYINPTWQNSPNVETLLAKELLALNDNGSLEIFGGKIVIDKLGNLALKEGDLEINKGQIIGNDSFRDKVTLKATRKQIRVEKNWDKAPVSIVATPSYNTKVWITNIDSTGFTINVEKSSAKDQEINWLANF